MDVEELLPQGAFDQFYLLPAKNMAGKGYTLNLETRSFGRIPSENILEAVRIYLTNTPSNINSPSVYANSLVVANTWKFGDFYLVETSGSGLLELGQAYESGWVAIGSGLKPLKQVALNSWANAWMVPSSGRVIIFFWPQLLEYMGLLFALLTPAFILLTNRRK